MAEDEAKCAGGCVSFSIEALTVSIIPINFNRKNNAHMPTPLHVVCYLQPSVAILTCQMVIPFFPIGEDPGGGTFIYYTFMVYPMVMS